MRFTVQEIEEIMKRSSTRTVEDLMRRRSLGIDQHDFDPKYQATVFYHLLFTKINKTLEENRESYVDAFEDSEAANEIFNKIAKDALLCVAAYNFDAGE